MIFSVFSVSACFIFLQCVHSSRNNLVDYNNTNPQLNNLTSNESTKTDIELLNPQRKLIGVKIEGTNKYNYITGNSQKRRQTKFIKENKIKQILNNSAGLFLRKSIYEKRKKVRRQLNIDYGIVEVITENTKNFQKHYSSPSINLEDPSNKISVDSFINQYRIRVGTNSSTNPRLLIRCNKNNGGCSQICKPEGRIKCSCLKGYILRKNGRECRDVNECRYKNGGCKDLCRNTLGGYYCDCSVGFRIAEDSKSCEDINECHLRNGHGFCQGTCRNTYGSYACDCSHLKGARLGSDKRTCEDIDECSETRHGCSHECINTRVGAFCSCPEGMELMSDYKTCEDVDECEDSSVRSLCKLGCVNTIGSYYCEDDLQSYHNSNESKIPSCPPLNPPRHGYISCLRNNSVSYNIFTRNGRRIIRNDPGTKCQLKCPVGFKLVGGGRFLCDFSGKWTVKRRGACIKSAYPKLECPPNQTITLRKKQKTVIVNFHRPQTNVRWKIVKSYPKWAKNLKGELAEGQHPIQFSVTDPASKLSSTCSFVIIIKK